MTLGPHRTKAHSAYPAPTINSSIEPLFLEKDQCRVDIISDTHGMLSPELLEQLQGADLILHAGDIVSLQDLETLRSIAPVHAVLGNNDYASQFGPKIQKVDSFIYNGVSMYMTHIFSVYAHSSAQVQVYGHTHAPYIHTTPYGFAINPGSPTFPRTNDGPTMARLIVGEGEPCEARIIHL